MRPVIQHAHWCGDIQISWVSYFQNYPLKPTTPIINLRERERNSSPYESRGNLSR